MTTSKRTRRRTTGRATSTSHKSTMGSARRRRTSAASARTTACILSTSCSRMRRRWVWISSWTSRRSYLSRQSPPLPRTTAVNQRLWWGEEERLLRCTMSGSRNRWGASRGPSPRRTCLTTATPSYGSHLNRIYLVDSKIVEDSKLVVWDVQLRQQWAAERRRQLELVAALSQLLCQRLGITWLGRSYTLSELSCS